MKSQQKLLFAGLCLAVAAGAFVLSQPPSLPPACQDAQEEMEQAVLNDNGLGAVITQGPVTFIRSAIVKRCSALSAAQCDALTARLRGGLEALAHTPWAPRMLQAAADVRHAFSLCHARRVSGEFKSYVESAGCSNAAITDIYKRIGYPYADLVEQFTAKRMAQAEALDKTGSGAAVDEAEFAGLALSISDEERRRVMTAARP